MTDDLRRIELARSAKRLNRARRSHLPALILMTDDDRLPDPLAAVRALPRGSLIIVRSSRRARRIELLRVLSRIAAEKGLLWSVADDPALAGKYGADGAHFPELSTSIAAHWRTRRPGWLITCAAHSLRACARAAQAGADAALLSPVFATESHAGRAALSPCRARQIAVAAPIAVFALGGIDARSARRLAGADFAGLAAIGAFRRVGQVDGASTVAPLGR